MTPMLDWHGVLSGQPLQWIISGFLTTIWVSVAGILLATLLAVLLLALRLGGGRAGRGLVAAWVSLFRNTPLLVQLLFWYFAAWNLLPLAVKEVVNDEHAWSILPGNVWWLTPEFLCSMWGLGVFTSAFLVEEIASGLRAVSHGQREAALSQGFTPWQELRFILLPQGLANAWQPIVGQYLNLMKLSSLASGIGFAELTYQVRQIESYNAHALEAFAVGTALYLALGVAMGVALTRLGPGRKLQRSANMNANLAVIADNLDYLLWGRLAEGQPGGVALTLLMAIGATLLALPGGIALAGLAWRYGGLVRRLLFLWAEIIRGIPLIFVIFWLWYLLPMLTGGDLPGAVTVTLALAWFTAASVMHSVLAGLQSLPKGQYEAALTQGFAPGQTLRLVLLPQALRNVQPSLVGIFIGLLKDTSLAFIVNVPELTTVAGQVNNRVQIYPLAIFVFTGAVYYLLCCGLSLLASRRFTRRATAG